MMDLEVFGGPRLRSCTAAMSRPAVTAWSRCGACSTLDSAIPAMECSIQPHHEGVGKHGVIPHELQWARLQLDVNRGLRRGAWYRVIRATDDGIILDVNRTPLTVPDAWLETVTGPPRCWSVVSRPRDVVKLPATWGDRYLTCPACRNRAPVRGHPLMMRCSRCRDMFVVDWAEFDARAHVPHASPEPSSLEPRVNP